MSVDTFAKSVPLVAVPSDNVLPRCLAYTPEHVRRADGTYIVRGLRSSSMLSCASALELALCLRMESSDGIRAIFSSAHPQFEVPSALIEAWDRVSAAGLSPTFMAHVEVAGRSMCQAIKVESAGCAVEYDREEQRAAYRACDLAYTILTEDWAEWHQAGSRLFLAECARPDAAVGSREEIVQDAVLMAVSEARPDETLADVLVEASLSAGVQPGAAMRAYGAMVASGRLGADLTAGPIRTDRPLGVTRLDDRGVHDAIAIADAWRAVFARECDVRFQA